MWSFLELGFSLLGDSAGDPREDVEDSYFIINVLPCINPQCTPEVSEMPGGFCEALADSQNLFKFKTIGSMSNLWSTPVPRMPGVMCWSSTSCIYPVTIQAILGAHNIRSSSHSEHALHKASRGCTSQHPFLMP